jgi:arsenate reductase
MKKRLLLVCTGNSARSIMGEAIVHKERGDAWDVESAGTEPRGVHPMSVRALQEISVDTSGLRSKHLSEFMGRQFDLVVTLCDSAAESCPFFPGGKSRVHLGFDDPAAATGADDKVLAVFRRVRDDIAKRLPALLDEFENMAES